MRWTDCRVVAFDTETTGLNPFDGDRVIELGAVELRLGAAGQVVGTRTFQKFVNPEMPIPRAATKVSGITDDDVADAPVFADVAAELRAFLSDAVLVAHNLNFDQNFIRSELRRLGQHWPRTRAEVDTLPLSQRLLPELKGHKLEMICAHLQIPLDNAHRASHDAEACGRALIELARRKEAPSDLVGFVDWAEAVGVPPDTGHLILGDRGVAEFASGPHKGKTVEEHPDHLQWMTIALERREGRWMPRFPDSVITWARRWLRAKATGWMPPGSKSPGPADWSIEPAIWLLQ